MKINQILDEYSAINKGIIDALKEKGYEFITKGGDQAVFLEPGGKTVLKIFGTQDYALAPDQNKKDSKPVFSEDHKMFFRWAKYCNEHSSNPFLPKFSGFESFYWDRYVYLQIRQERMYPLKTVLGNMMEDMASFAKDGYSFNEMLDVIDRYYDKELPSLERQVGKSGIKLLYKTIVMLESIGNEIGANLDLHSDNFLSRTPDGEFPVIVDPWVL